MIGIKDKSPKFQITLEDLLDTVKGEDISKITENHKFSNPILSFIQAFEIDIGKEPVSDKVLFTLFKHWNKTTLFTQRSFNSQLELYIPSERKNKKYFYINKKFTEIAEKIEKIEQKRAKPRSKSKTAIKHFESFLQETGIGSGSLYVEWDILYYVYNRWCDDNRKICQFGERSFCDMCHLYFDHKMIARNSLVWFLLNNNIKKYITKEEVERWRQGRKKYAAKTETQNKNEIPHPKYQDQTLYFKKNKKK